MTEQPKSISELVDEIAQLELAEQPDAFSKLHDQLDLELNRADRPDTASETQ